MVASCPSLRWIFRKRPVQCREAEGLVTELWSPRFVAMQWLCSQLCYVTAANQWTLVETELLATKGWKCGCQPFSCRCCLNATHCRKKICWTCLFKEYIPAIPFWNSKLPLHARSLRFLRAAVRSTIFALNFGCIMPMPSLKQQKKHLSYAEKQSVWSRSCGLQDLLQCSDCALSCAMGLLQTSEQLSTLSFQQQWVGNVAASLSAADVLKMWRTAGRRFVQHVCNRNQFLPFLFGFQAPTFYQKQVPESGSTLHSLCIAVASCPSLRCSCRKKTCPMQRSRVVTELWSPRFVAMQWLCSQLCYVTAANQWTTVDIELSATMGWKCGCQPFSCRCWQNVTHCRKEICSTCLFKESIPAIPFWNSKYPLPTKSFRFLRAAARSTRSALWLHHALLFVAAAAKRPVQCREAEWSRSCGLQDLLQCSDCALSCAMWLLQTNEQLSTLSFQQQWVGNVAASLSAADVGKMWLTAGRRFVRHVCLRNPFPPFLFGIPSIHSLPKASGSWERQHAPPGLHYGCIMPFSLLQLQKKTRLMQRSRMFGHGVVVFKICYNAVMVLLSDCCNGLEVGLPAIQLPMCAKCDALPKGDLLDMFVSGIHSRHSFLEFQASTPYQKLAFPESGSTLHQVCIMVASCPSLCCSCRKKTCLM